MPEIQHLSFPGSHSHLRGYEDRLAAVEPTSSWPTVSPAGLSGRRSNEQQPDESGSSQPRSSSLRWWSKAWLFVAGLAFLGSVLAGPLSGLFSQRAAKSQSPGWRPISAISVGQRVLANAPVSEEHNTLSDTIVPSLWRKLTLRAPKLDGTSAEVVLLRPDSWIQENGAVSGGNVEIYVPECSIEGVAQVLSIAPCPNISSGKGQVVTGTFKHASAAIVDLYVEGLDSTIGTTSNHLFWSEDRQLFIPASDLRSGERLRGIHGRPKLLKSALRPGSEPVYNLEVQLAHVYHISEEGLLVHNPPVCPLHHIVSIYGNVTRALKWARNWVELSQDLLKKAGIDLEAAANKVRIKGHTGPHPELYHRRVYERLSDVARNLRGNARKKAILDELERIANELKADPSKLSGVGL